MRTLALALLLATPATAETISAEIARTGLTPTEARLAAHADEAQVGSDVGATSTANWLAHVTRQTRPVAHGTVSTTTRLHTAQSIRRIAYRK